MKRSDEFSKLEVAQRQVNAFFWSSEFAYKLVRQKVLTGEIHCRNPNTVDTVFADVNCHAFVPPNIARRRRAAGEIPRFNTKYNATTRQFEIDLRNNLEQICRYVIVRFYGALEQYLTTRASPFLNLAGLGSSARYNKIRNFQSTAFQDMAKYLDNEGAALQKSVPSDKAALAQACRMLRNHVVHKEGEWQPPWKDDEFRNQIEKTFADNDDLSLIMRGLCDKAKRRAENQGDVPVLFFYAIYSLTDFRNFANAIEAALPL
jgi:hypothetical protein